MHTGIAVIPVGNVAIYIGIGLIPTENWAIPIDFGVMQTADGPLLADDFQLSAFFSLKKTSLAVGIS